MMSNLKVKFERSCRLCAQEQDVTLLIFSAEAEDMLLRNKLNKYLLIEVDEDDKLPKNICIQCCTKLQTVCEFIDLAHNSQDILLSRSIELDRLELSSISHSDDHIISTENKCEDNSEEKSETTSMEISVDPMIVLQNSDPSSLNVDVTCLSQDEDVAHLHGLDGENVTIKLIKKGETIETENDCNENVPSYVCKICTKRFTTEYSYTNHYWTHKVDDIGRQDYTCSICNEEFEYKNKLIKHLKIHKTGGNCIICGRIFRTAEKLTIHMNVHAKDSFFTCKICGRSYDTLSTLRTHSIAHSNERPYECHVCPKTFKRNQDLKFHMNQHTGIRPYKCPFCEKSFASSGNCYSHRSRMHPGRPVLRGKVTRSKQFDEEPSRSIAAKAKEKSPKITKPVKFKCHICSHTFMKRDNFTYHMYQHTGEKPFHCSYCTEQFVTRRGLLIHHDSLHPTKNRPLALLSRNMLLM